MPLQGIRKRKALTVEKKKEWVGRGNAFSGYLGSSAEVRKKISFNFSAAFRARIVTHSSYFYKKILSLPVFLMVRKSLNYPFGSCGLDLFLLVMSPERDSVTWFCFQFDYERIPFRDENNVYMLAVTSIQSLKRYHKVKCD